MTALSEYQQLESIGLWRENIGAQRREVAVAFRDASLVIADSKSASPLAHWSLPALVRRNPGILPAVYAPDIEYGEELEIADETMVEAIDKVHRLIAARRPRPGRLRAVSLIVGLAASLGVAFVFLPDGLIRHTARVVPATKQQEIGLAILADLSRVTGMPCSTGAGAGALHRLEGRVLAAGHGGINVLPAGLSGALALPGGAIVVGRDVVEAPASPEAVAGFILAETARAGLTDPFAEFLRWAGFGATFRLLTTGEMPDTAVAGYGTVLLAGYRHPVDDNALIDEFRRSALRAAPYAYALDPTGESVLALIEADSLLPGTPEPLLSDAEWAALQGICN